MNERRVIRAFGDAFAGSLSAAMGRSEPAVVIPMPCYWCPDDATDTHYYDQAIGHVPVCDYCKKLSMRPMDYARRAIEAARLWWQ